MMSEDEFVDAGRCLSSRSSGFATAMQKLLLRLWRGRSREDRVAKRELRNETQWGWQAKAQSDRTTRARMRHLATSESDW